MGEMGDLCREKAVPFLYNHDLYRISAMPAGKQITGRVKAVII